MPICPKCSTVVANDYDMRKDIIKPTSDAGDYKPGHRKEVKVKDAPSKLKVGAKGLDAIVKPNK